MEYNNKTTLSPRKVCIFGAQGFVGKELIKGLADSKLEIYAPTSSELNLLDPKAALFLKEFFKPRDVIIMLASIPRGFSEEYESFKKNLIIADTLSSAVEDSNIAQFIYLSSDSVYSNSIKKISDQTLASPDSLYGLMHRSRELIFSQKLSTKKITILRSTMIIGSGDTHRAYGPNKFFQSALTENKITLFGQGEDIKDYIYVEDVVKILTRVVIEGITGIAILASGRSYSALETATLIKEIMGHNIRINFAPRNIPVSQRHFDISSLLNKIPIYTPTPLENALKIMYKNIA